MNFLSKQPSAISRRQMLVSIGVSLTAVMVSGCGGGGSRLSSPSGDSENSFREVVCDPITRIFVASATEVIGVLGQAFLTAPESRIKAAGIALIVGSNILEVLIESYCGSFTVEISLSDSDVEALSQQASITVSFIAPPETDNARDALSNMSQKGNHLSVTASRNIQATFNVVESNNLPLELR